jgi:hypothetical protein
MIRNIQNALWRLILVANVRLVLAMASRKPLVQVGGEIQQLQAGDTLTGPFADTEQVSLTNDDVGSHVLGDVVYIDAADGAKKAKADAAATSKAIAFATATVTAGSSGSYQTSGVLAGLAGLTAGSTYYLSAATAGAMSVTAPSTVSQYVVKLGIAISATELMIDIEPRILL